MKKYAHGTVSLESDVGLLLILLGLTFHVYFTSLSINC